jgi:hypothetical protein
MPDLEWFVTTRVEDIPADTPVLIGGEVLGASLSDHEDKRQVRWYRRPTPEELEAKPQRTLVFTPTEKQLAELREVAEPLTAAARELIEESSAAWDRGEHRLGQGLLLLVNLVLAKHALILASFKAGQDWRDAHGDFDVEAQRRRVEEAIATSSGT